MKLATPRALAKKSKRTEVREGDTYVQIQRGMYVDLFGTGKVTERGVTALILVQRPDGRGGFKAQDITHYNLPNLETAKRVIEKQLGIELAWHKYPSTSKWDNSVLAHAWAVNCHDVLPLPKKPRARV